MELELAGRAFVVTGGSDGLGAAAVRGLVGEGAKVAYCARGLDRLEQVQRSLAGLPGEGLPIVSDVTTAAGCGQVVEAAVARFGRLDGLVNNAGTSAAQPFLSVTDEGWQADLDLKLMAAVRLARLCIPHLKTAGGGSVVNVLALSAKAAGARSAPSSVSRAAGMALTKALAKELGPERIRVNAVLIGMVESGQWRRRAEAAGLSQEALQEKLAAEHGIPLGRFGKASEFGDLVAFLSSARAAYLTGTAINFDGGLSPVV